MMIAGGSKAAVRRAATHGLGFISQVDRPELRTYYEAQCRTMGTVPGFVQFPVPDSPTAVFVADNVDQAWEQLGPHLLHDAAMAASYRHGDDSVASITRATDCRRAAPGRRTVPHPDTHGGNGIRPRWEVASVASIVRRHRTRRGVALSADSGGGPSASPDGPRMSKEQADDRSHSRGRMVDGGVGSVAVDGIRHRPDLKLVGVWVHSPDKVGRDAGELVGGDPIGLAATNDADALIALKPDCVVYAASGPQRDAGAVPDYLKLLAAGINVVSTSTTSLVYPPSYFATEWRDQLAAAAQAGDASFYASGIFPGFASDQLALLMTTQSKKIRTLTATEIALNDHYPVADVMINGMGFARPLDFEPMLKTPGFIEIAWKAPIHLIADGLGVEVEEIRGTLDRELTDRDIEVAFGTIPAGTCGAVRTRAAGVVEGREAIVVEHIIRMARDVAPHWPTSDADATYRVDIEGDPDIHCAMTSGRR